MPWRSYGLRLCWFYLGLAVCCTGASLVIRASVGAAPWDIFHIGLSDRTGIGLGLVVQSVGVVIILLNMALQIKPTLGMVLNMLSFGPMLQYALTFFSTPESLLMRWLMLAVGVLVIGLGTALYVSANLGQGPRDGMMIGLTRILGLPVAVVKNSLDVLVTLGGWLLGGPVGIGTVVVALTVGPAIQFGLYLMERLARFDPFSSFVRPVVLRRH